MPAMLSTFTLILATAFFSNSETSWMRPESFHLAIGMNRGEVVETLEGGGWKPKKGDDADHLIVDYSVSQSLTLEFHKGRLRSIRFELYTVLHQIGGAFEEEKAYLRKTFGEPKAVNSKSVLIYESTLPNVMAVVNDDPKSHNGKKGLGVLVVRYYDPAPAK
jgi:hypothetical protein